jgi:hypothetical protein
MSTMTGITSIPADIPYLGNAPSRRWQFEVTIPGPGPSQVVLELLPPAYAWPSEINVEVPKARIDELLHTYVYVDLSGLSAGTYIFPFARKACWGGGVLIGGVVDRSSRWGVIVPETQAAYIVNVGSDNLTDVTLRYDQAFF